MLPSGVLQGEDAEEAHSLLCAAVAAAAAVVTVAVLYSATIVTVLRGEMGRFKLCQATKEGGRG